MEIELKHGIANSYNQGCRCAHCKKAKADYRRNTPIKGHGTKWYYDKGCRCFSCRAAKNEAKRKQYGRSPRKITTDIKRKTRICYGCHIEKPLDEFTKSRSKRAFMGRLHECKVCHNERGLVTRQTSPVQRYSTYKYGAKIRNLFFSLTFEEFESFWSKPCYYCGDIIVGIGLDRKDSSLGYQKGNIVSCCSRCNYAKKNQTEAEFISMCKKVTEKFKDHIVPPENIGILS